MVLIHVKTTTKHPKPARYPPIKNSIPDTARTIKIRLMNDGLTPDTDQLARFKEHAERGVTLLHNRVKEFPDLVTLT